MSTLEDRLLGEKKEYYCSSSEDENDEDCNDKSIENPSAAESYPADEYEKGSTNTGPKGVIKDWQRFKQLETEQKREQERERINLAKKLTLSCRSHLDDEKAKEKEENVDDMIDEQILQEYIVKRMKEMMENTSQKKVFGQVLSIGSPDELLDAIDKEEKDVTVVINLFEDSAPGCAAMKGSIISLASDYPHVKFCNIRCSNAGLGKRFQKIGLPALLVYKGAELIGNYIRLIDDFGEDFFATDVEAFLIERGIILDKNLIPPEMKTIKGPSIQTQGDSDSE